MKTREFGQPCAVPQPGRCRICGCSSGPDSLGDGLKEMPTDAFVCLVGTPPNRRQCRWVDETRTLCDAPKCVAAARAELGLR